MSTGTNEEMETNNAQKRTRTRYNLDNTAAKYLPFEAFDTEYNY